MKNDVQNGDIYGRLMILSNLPIRKLKGKRYRTYYECQCNCGNIRYVLRENIVTKRTKSCGCFGAEKLTKYNTTHNDVYSPTYASWAAMVARCKYEGIYPNYANIEVCSRWKEANSVGYLNFKSDMGERPDGMSIDRKDPSGGYNPDNCRWADLNTQAYNKLRGKRNTSGRVGVCFSKIENKFKSYISYKGLFIHLGTYKEFSDAVKAREDGEIKYYGYIKHLK